MCLDINCVHLSAGFGSPKLYTLTSRKVASTECHGIAPDPTALVAAHCQVYCSHADITEEELDDFCPTEFEDEPVRSDMLRRK